MEKIQTKRVICTQKKTESSAARPLERGSCKQVARAKTIQLEFLSVSDDNHHSLFTAVETGSSPEQPQVPLITQTKLDSLTLSLWWCPSYTRIWHRMPCYCPNRSGEKYVFYVLSVQRQYIALKAVLNIGFGTTYHLSLTKKFWF